VAVLFYLHFAALGAVLVSSFWSLVGERFDPRATRRHVGRIVAGGTVGGVLGGILAGRVAVTLSVDAMFPLLALLHLGCAGLVLVAGRGSRAAEPTEVEEPVAGLHVIRTTPYLRTLVAVVLLTTVGEGLLDWVFKARVTATLGRGEEYLRLFGWFYTGVAVLTVVLQTGAARHALRILGPSRTVGTQPLTLILGSLAALLVPGVPVIMAARGAEGVARQGLQRAGYELLFTPLLPREKRSTKALLDVGAVRLGDILAAGLVQAALFGGWQAGLLGIAIGLSLLAIAVVPRLERGYLGALERKLSAGMRGLGQDDAEASAVWSTMLQTVGGAPREEQTPSPPPAAVTAPSGATRDVELQRVLDLRSRDQERVRAALGGPALTRPLVGHAIPLLAWDAVARETVAALRAAGPQVVGQLTDHLLDHDQDFAIRRRIPLVLAAHPTARAVQGLVHGLGDPRFEVRYRCGLALHRILACDGSLQVDADVVRAAVLREVSVDRRVWEGHRVLDRLEDEEWSPVFDELLRERANRGLQHVFTMLALILPREPLRLAFRGLHATDPMLRGTALEFLEALLPADIRAPLWPFLEDTRTGTAPRRSRDDVLRDLQASQASIAVDLERVRRGRRE
jgi:hypothetical protein